MQRQHHLALIFITHNLGIVAKMCDQLAVMYAGRVVESGPVSQIFNSPAHPYTSSLTGINCRDLAASYEKDTGKHWTQPIPFKHALFEVVWDVLKRTTAKARLPEFVGA